jgi:transcriptional regulator with XRE-family HTH domain
LIDEGQTVADRMVADSATPLRVARTDPLDLLIGRRVRRLRAARGLSQTELGNAINVTFQQIQKYEAGTNRIAASTLVRIAAALDVAPDELLTGQAPTLSDDPGARPSLLSTPGAEALLVGYAKLGSETLRRAVLSLVREMNGERAPTGPR